MKDLKRKLRGRFSLVPHNRLTHGLEEKQAAAQTVASGQWAMGERTGRLEKALCRLTRHDHAVGVATGLSALRLSLLALGVRDGEVILPAYSCVALANAVLSAGAKPVIADVIPGEWNIDPCAVSRLMNKRTKAILAVHTFGLPARIAELKTHGVPVIEDCAHAIGMRTEVGALGSLGDICVLSFYATKLVGAGEGGAVLTDRKNIADFIKKWRNYADQPASPTRLNDKMTDMNAAIAAAQLKRLPSMIRERRRIASIYEKRLKKSDFFVLPESTRPRIWYRYVIKARAIGLDVLIRRMRARGVVVERPVIDWRDGDGASAPVANEAYRTLASLPIYPSLTQAEQKKVCDGLSFVCGRDRK